MQFGFFSGLLWGLDTVILGIGLALAPYIGSAEALACASIAGSFLLMPSVQFGSLATWESEAD